MSENATPTVRLVKATRHERRRPEWVPGRYVTLSNGRGYRTRGYMTETQASYEKKPRLYVDVEGEGFWENFANRTSRPHNLYRSVLKDALVAAGLPADTKVRWNPKAGCSMCPCSPGFVLDYDRKDDYRHNGTRRREQPFDIYVTVTADDPDTLKSNDPAEAFARTVQVVADPTMPFPTEARDAAQAVLAEARQ